MDLVLIGAGRVGTAVAVLLQQRGHRVAGVASRSSESAGRAGFLLNAPVFAVSDLPTAEVALLGVPEDVIADVCADVAGFRRWNIVCHFAGAVGILPLGAATQNGMFAAALHPLQSCPDVETAVRHLPGSAWGVTASDEVRKWARDLVATDLQGSPVAVAESDRALWHAAAVTTANGITALLSLAEAMLSEIGVGHPGVVLGPLATGVVANTATRGAAATLTGPVVRGEARTIRSHIEALSTSAPGLLDSYRLVAHTILGAAISAGRIDPATAGSIRAELEG